jgi:hypothetical protein
MKDPNDGPTTATITDYMSVYPHLEPFTYLSMYTHM